MPLYQPVSSATALPDGIVAFADLASGTPAALAADPAFTGTYVPILAPTAVKTADHTAAVGELVLANVTGGGFAVTAPTGATAGQRWGVVRIDASANTLTLGRQGTDVYTSGTGTATSMTVLLQDRTIIFESDGAGAWRPVEGYQALAAMDSRFAGLALWPTLTSGAYYYAASPTSSGTSNSLGVGTMRATPLWLPRGAALARIGAEVTAAGDAGSKVRLGIYADNGAGYPGALVVDAGTINGDSNTVQEITINQTLAAGLYWFAGVVQVVTVTQPTVRTVNAWMPPIQLIAGTSLPGAGGAVHGVSTTGITGALPNPFPAGGGASGLAPRLLFRAT